jgi:N-acetylmuramoyl-L-alanine amidase
MPKIFLAIGHNDSDPGAVSSGTTEHAEVKKVVEIAAENLKKMGVDLFVPPTNLNLAEKISWINDRANATDFAIEIHLDAGSATATGSSVWFLVENETEKSVAEYFAPVLAARLGVGNRGAKPDTSNNHGRLGFVRDTICPAFLFECGFLTNSTDLQKFRENGESAIFESVVDLFLAGNPLLNPSDAWAFRDVPPAHFAFDAVKKAKQKGILTDHPEFRPNDPISRGEVLVLFERLSLLN